jgi:hypothetical protein
MRRWAGADGPLTIGLAAHDSASAKWHRLCGFVPIAWVGGWMWDADEGEPSDPSKEPS